MTKPTLQSLKLELNERNSEIQLFQAITNTISYNLDLDEVLSEIVNIVSMTMRADSCLIYLTQDHSLILKASKIPHPKMINKVAMKFGEGITGWVAQKRELAVISAEAYHDNRFKIVPYLDEDRWEAFISVPIIFHDNVVGVINVQNRKARVHTPKEIQLIKTIASQVGGAISNAQLLSETITLKQALQARKVIEKAKGLLMKQQHLSEDEAYGILRKKSMDAKKTMQEVAEAIVLVLNA